MLRPGGDHDHVDDVVLDDVDHPRRVTPYEVLGVDPRASDAEIRRAYVRLARRYHPDVQGGAEDRMREVNEAWAVVGDAQRRAAWDRRHRDAPDPGFRPDEPADDGFDPRDLVDVPYRPMTEREQQRRGLATLVPVAVFATAVAVVIFGFFFDSGPMIGAGVVLFSVACLGMVGVLLVALVDAKRS